MDINKKKDTILLLIDDDTKLGTVYDHLGTKFSYINASSSIDAFSKMAFNIPSLIIADIDIDSINILNFLKTIRTGIKTKLIPFLILSSVNNQDNRIKAIEYGVDSFLQYPINPEELKAVVHSTLNKFKEFYLLTITDELTRLYNRKEFIKKFNDEISEVTQKIISLAIIDIDHFKQVNDIYGHQTGDLVLMKLASVLKSWTSKSFFPARFGGEEFVILFPDVKITDAVKTMKEVLETFSSIEFEVNKQYFHVTFSAGLSEYPAIGNSISELLSRADQALYAAKNDGRNLVYTFSPIMARNDKFWEFLKSKREIFVQSGTNEAITGLPFLPHLLDIISSLDFEVQSIGVLIVTIKNMYDIDSIIGFKNYAYDIENIKRIIIRATELVFPSDAYLGISDLYNHEFVILFPSVVDFSFNLIKFKDICKEISLIINENMKNLPVDISYSSDVTLIRSANPRKILMDIESIKNNTHQLSDKSRIFAAYYKSFKNLSKILTIKDFIKFKNCYNIKTNEINYHYFALKKPFEYMNMLNPILQEQIDSIKKLKEFLYYLKIPFLKKLNAPLLFPYLPKLDFHQFLNLLCDELPGKKIVIMLNEFHVINCTNDVVATVSHGLPENIQLGIDNCFIGNEILNYLSKFSFSILAFSENIVRNIHLFKNRIKIISGLTLFLEQITVPSLAYNIQSDAEYQLICDLHINCCSGQYIEQQLKGNRPGKKKRK